jgi:integrase
MGPLRKCSIANFRFHDLRHTCASHFVMSRGDLYTLREILGHKTVTMTQRYAHRSPAHKAEVARVMDTFWTLSDKSTLPSAKPVPATSRYT